MSFLNALNAERAKLSGSLVWLLVFGAPAMLLVMGVMVIATGNGPQSWAQYATGSAAVWAYFLMPLCVTALTALIASVEHQSQGWTWSLAQPTPKWLIFSAKATLTVLMLVLMTALVWAAILVGGEFGSALSPQHALPGSQPLSSLAETLGKMWMAGLLASSIQFTVAHAHKSFALPIVVGIGGTFVSVVATSAQAGLYFPWLLPVNILSAAGERADQALLTGLIGGVIVFAASCIWLARRDWR